MSKFSDSEEVRQARLLIEIGRYLISDCPVCHGAGAVRVVQMADGSHPSQDCWHCRPIRVLLGLDVKAST